METPHGEEVTGGYSENTGRNVWEEMAMGSTAGTS